MEVIKKKPTHDVHVYIPELKDLYRKGRINRRECLRTATVLGLSSLVVILRPDADPHWPSFSRLFEIGMAVAILVAYAQLLPELGFVVTTAVASAYLSWRLGSTPLQSAIAGIVIAFGIYAVFHLILGLSLARGPWGF